MSQSTETTDPSPLLHYARMHGIVPESEPPDEPPLDDTHMIVPEPNSPQAQRFQAIESRYDTMYETFCAELNDQKLDISQAAKDLVATILREDREDNRIKWEDILPKAPVISTDSQGEKLSFADGLEENLNSKSASKKHETLVFRDTTNTPSQSQGAARQDSS